MPGLLTVVPAVRQRIDTRSGAPPSMPPCDALSGGRRRFDLEEQPRDRKPGNPQERHRWCNVIWAKRMPIRSKFFSASSTSEA
jgi:hypothetical protein